MSGDKSSSERSSITGVTQIMETAGYKLGKAIGVGSYSSVRLAYNLKANNQLVACKIINKDKASPKFIKKFLPRELEILKKIKHPHIVKVLNMFGLGTRVFVFMNYCSQGDLLDYIQERGALPEADCKVLFSQLLSALQYLHSLHIAHRDLKCENILLARPDYAMLTDFGFSRFFSPGTTPLSTTFCGSAAYAAPEIIDGTPYDPLCGDIWSLGCVLYIMLTGRMPYDDSQPLAMVRQQRARRLAFPRGEGRLRVSSRAKLLVMKCLEPEPRLRASLTQLATSPWCGPERMTRVRPR